VNDQEPPMSSSEQQHPKARNVRLLVLDVDGVLTDGRLLFGNAGEELKAFDIQDGLGIKLLARGGVATAIITGRRSALVARRAQELGIQHLLQGREDKQQALIELCADLSLSLAETAYMGDDLPDLGAIRTAGFGIAPANAHWFVARHADHRTARSGGNGAVREACELILASQGKLDRLLESYL
jgi:3-deoxy-D-manno-octulosonate 8-phosphate phosphatase (KDO 8-P phosphatase)